MFFAACSRATKVPDAYHIDRWNMETPLEWFRDREAAQILPQNIERKAGGRSFRRRSRRGVPHPLPFL